MYEILKCRLYEKILETSRGRDDNESVGGDDNPLNRSLRPNSLRPFLEWQRMVDRLYSRPSESPDDADAACSIPSIVLPTVPKSMRQTHPPPHTPVLDHPIPPFAHRRLSNQGFGVVDERQRL